ncbi:hypothetical protein EZBTHKR_3162 [Elizabethkingia anophelis]|nr:hypothetical protein EZBTHKR_3162 [Elizabethkingia anophelis]
MIRCEISKPGQNPFFHFVGSFICKSKRQYVPDNFGSVITQADLQKIFNKAICLSRAC